VQQLNTQHIFHPLTQNTIIAFKSCAQAIFSLSENLNLCGVSTNKTMICFIAMQTYKEHTNSCYAKLRAISNLFSFFYTPCIYIYISQYYRNLRCFQKCAQTRLGVDYHWEIVNWKSSRNYLFIDCWEPKCYLLKIGNQFPIKNKD
jgi:hypothetical protein